MAKVINKAKIAPMSDEQSGGGAVGEGTAQQPAPEAPKPAEPSTPSEGEAASLSANSYPAARCDHEKLKIDAGSGANVICPVCSACVPIHAIGEVRVGNRS